MQVKSTNWPLIGLLLMAGLFAAGQFGKFTLTLDLLHAPYGAAASVMVTLVGLVGIIFGAVAGGRIARAGLRWSLLLALGAGGALSLIQAALPPTPVMLILRAVEGMSHLAIVVSAPTLMAGLSSERDRPVVMGIWASFFGVALALLALLLPLLLPMGGLRAVLIFHGLGMGAVGLCLWAYLPEAPRSAEPPKPYLAEHIRIYSNPRSVIAGAGFVFYTLVYIALIAVLPGALGLKVHQVSILPILSLFGTFGAGFLARHMAPPVITMIGFAATAVAMLGIYIWPGMASAVILFLAVGLIPGGAFATIPYFNSALPDRARAMGAIAQCGNIGTTLGTPIFVFALVYGGLGLLTAVTIAFCIAGGAVLLILWPKAEAALRQLPQN